MKKKFLATLLFPLTLMSSCKTNETQPQGDTPPDNKVNPIDINIEGFEFLDKMQGHWVGKNEVLSWKYDWFAFDYRAVSSSHVFGIFEGGTMGNLFTSFFVTDYMGKRTIMARNGGLLNGIYRTSYFVLDKVERSGNRDYYRLVDAIGGSDVMYMELFFKGDSLEFNAYTSRIGTNKPATQHMHFKAKKRSTPLAANAASSFNFPKNEVEKDFSNGFVSSHLYVNPGETEGQSATFMSMDNSLDLQGLAYAAGDPFTVGDHSNQGTLDVTIERNNLITAKNLLVYLSEQPLTDASGYMDINAFESILLFPEIDKAQDEFTFTYLHPGEYYITVIADVNADGYPSQGDVTHVSQKINITAGGKHSTTVKNINVQN
jgi:hypothetical protein